MHLSLIFSGISFGSFFFLLPIPPLPLVVTLFFGGFLVFYLAFIPKLLFFILPLFHPAWLVSWREEIKEGSERRQDPFTKCFRFRVSKIFTLLFLLRAEECRVE